MAAVRGWPEAEARESGAALLADLGGRDPAVAKRIMDAYLASAEDPVLPADWVGITTMGHTATNYQLMPGDRVYV